MTEQRSPFPFEEQVTDQIERPVFQVVAEQSAREGLLRRAASWLFHRTGYQPTFGLVSEVVHEEVPVHTSAELPEIPTARQTLIALARAGISMSDRRMQEALVAQDRELSIQVQLRRAQ